MPKLNSTLTAPQMALHAVCPQCQASLIFPNPRTCDGQAYCEECGWPEENRPANPNCVRCGKGGTYCDGERWLCDECSIAMEPPSDPSGLKRSDATGAADLEGKGGQP